VESGYELLDYFEVVDVERLLSIWMKVFQYRGQNAQGMVSPAALAGLL